MKDGTGGARIETEQSRSAAPRRRGRSGGFPGGHAGQADSDATPCFQVVGRAAQPAPLTHREAGNVLTPDNDAELVRMNGQLLSVLTGPTAAGPGAQGRAKPFSTPVSTRSRRPTRSIRFAPAACLSVTGVYSYQCGPAAVVPAASPLAGDVRVLAAAPWWTLRPHRVMVGDPGARSRASAALWMRAIAKRKRQEYQAVLNERTRVARELHDTLEQGLAGIALQLEAVAGSFQTRAGRRRSSRSTSRGRCCATAWKRRGGRSWTCGRRRSRAATSAAR